MPPSKPSLLWPVTRRFLRLRALLFAAALPALLLPSSKGRAEPAPEEPAVHRPAFASSHAWFFIDLEVSNLPAEAAFVPVSADVDFTKWLLHLDTRGTVDERSLRLVHLLPDGTRKELPAQFTASPQPRAKERRFLSDTNPGVSYVTEYPAAEARLQVSGRLGWIASADETGVARFRLYFGAPKHGRFVQVPYAPHHFRWFHEEGRANEPRFFSRMQIKPQWPYAGEVRVFDQQELVTAYQTGPALNSARGAEKTRRPFLYPLIGPDGVALTEFGKTHDPTGSHAHHYSLWIAHADVNGRDFWSERGGVIAHDQFARIEEGPVFARLVQRTRWVFEETALLHERRTWTFFHAAPEFRIIDLELELAPAGTEPVTFGKTSFGFLAVRVAPSISVFDGGGEIRNAEGGLNEQRAHLKRAAWIDQSGPVAPGKWNGIAIFDHPSNFNHPTGWHCRNDGWAGASFNLEAPYELAPGNRLDLRYRLHLHRHDATRGEVARRYAEFSAAPHVRFGEPAPVR